MGMACIQCAPSFSFRQITLIRFIRMAKVVLVFFFWGGVCSTASSIWPCEEEQGQNNLTLWFRRQANRLMPLALWHAVIFAIFTVFLLLLLFLGASLPANWYKMWDHFVWMTCWQSQAYHGVPIMVNLWNNARLQLLGRMTPAGNGLTRKLWSLVLKQEK